MYVCTIHLCWLMKLLPGKQCEIWFKIIDLWCLFHCFMLDEWFDWEKTEIQPEKYIWCATFSNAISVGILTRKHLIVWFYLRMPVTSHAPTYRPPPKHRAHSTHNQLAVDIIEAHVTYSKKQKKTTTLSDKSNNRAKYDDRIARLPGSGEGGKRRWQVIKYTYIPMYIPCTYLHREWCGKRVKKLIKQKIRKAKTYIYLKS